MRILQKESLGRIDVQRALGVKSEAHFRENYIMPALDKGLIEMTQPNSPNSPTQKYKITRKGRRVLKKAKR